MRILAAFVLAFFLTTASHAESPAASDQKAIEQVISDQLAAFAADNGPNAFEFAAPIIKGMFGGPDNFMAMVKKGYQPIYRNKSHEFGEFTVDATGRPAQHVTITSANGKSYSAVYTMEQQPDGHWKISGCYLAEIPSVDA
jgi:ketosteroid isomerase-like protein